MSAEVQAALVDRFVLVERGVVDIKGLGPMSTYILKGPLLPGSALPDGKNLSEKTTDEADNAA